MRARRRSGGSKGRYGDENWGSHCLPAAIVPGGWNAQDAVMVSGVPQGHRGGAERSRTTPSSVWWHRPFCWVHHARETSPVTPRAARPFPTTTIPLRLLGSSAPLHFVANDRARTRTTLSNSIRSLGHHHRLVLGLQRDGLMPQRTAVGHTAEGRFGRTRQRDARHKRIIRYVPSTRVDAGTRRNHERNEGATEPPLSTRRGESVNTSHCADCS